MPPAEKIGNSQAVGIGGVKNAVLALPTDKKTIYFGMGAMYFGNKNDTMAICKFRQEAHFPGAHGPIVVGEATGIPKTYATITTQPWRRHGGIRTASRRPSILHRCLP